MQSVMDLGHNGPGMQGKNLTSISSGEPWKTLEQQRDKQTRSSGL